MYNRLFTAFNGFKGAVNQLFPALGQHLYPHVIRYQLTVYQLTQEIELYLARSRKADFDLLKAQLYQVLEHLNFFFHNHGIDQRLVSIPQVNAAPHRRLLNLLPRPFSFRVINYRILPVSLIIQHTLPPVQKQNRQRLSRPAPGFLLYNYAEIMQRNTQLIIAQKISPLWLPEHLSWAD